MIQGFLRIDRPKEHHSSGFKALKNNRNAAH